MKRNNHKPTNISDAVLLHLIDNRGRWIPSYSLDGKTFHGKFSGMSGSRRASDMSRQGYREYKGVKYFIESRRKGKIFEYRCIGGEKEITKWQEVEKDGEIMVRPIQETLNI